MSTATLDPSRSIVAASPADAVVPARNFGVWVLAAVLFSSACIAVGLIWDISWHMSIGRDTLWSPPHVLEQIGASLAGLSCGAYVLWITFRGDVEARSRTVSFWGFRGPLGAWVSIWGALTMIASVPFDDWWHNAYGLDVQILSPPHTVLLAGMIAIQVGAMLLALSAQNRPENAGRRRFGIMYACAAGILVTMGAITFFEHIGWANEWHRSGFYRVAAGVFPLFLVAVGRASRLRWPASAAAATYMGIVLVMMWTLQLFPAQAMLAPIYNPITHMVPLPFPLLLVIPALAIDLLMRRFRGNDWALAAVIGVAFVLVMFAVHWPFGDFMLSDAAKNYLFAAGQWPYTVTVGPGLEEFWRVDPGMGAFLFGMGVACLYGFISARIGLAWGNWMRRVVR